MKDTLGGHQDIFSYVCKNRDYFNGVAKGSKVEIVQIVFGTRDQTELGD